MPPGSDRRALLQALRRFTEAGSVEGRAQVVRRHPELLSPASDALLCELEADARTTGLTDQADPLTRARNFFTRCRKHGLDKASAQDREMLNYLRFTGLAKAGMACYDRYVRSGNRGDLCDAVRLLQQAYDECPRSSPNFTRLASSLSVVYQAQYALTGDDCDLDRAVDLGEEASASSQADQERHKQHINLAAALLERFVRHGQRADLGRVFELLVPAERELDRLGDAWQKAAHNLAAALRQRASLTDSHEDIEAAINLLAEVAGAAQRGTSASALYHGSLANAYQQRLNRTGRAEDLRAAIAAYHIALTDTPSPTTERARLLNNLGIALATQYEISGDTAALNEALLLFCESVQVLPPPAPAALGTLANLGTYMAARYSHTLKDEDYRNALHWLALAETHLDGKPELAGVLDNLANARFTRFHQKDDHADLDAAITLWERSLAFQASPGHEFDRKRNLASALSQRHLLNGCQGDLNRARELFVAAIGMPTANLGSELTAANNWGHSSFDRAVASNAADDHQEVWRETARAFDIARAAADRLRHAQITRRHEADWIAKTQQTPARHSYALFKSGQPERAVEALEAGRSVFLAEALERNRADLQRLDEIGHRELLKQYREAITMMQLAELAIVAPGDIPGIVADNTRREAIAQQLRESIEGIRGIPGFENFFRPLSFSEVKALAVAPLVYLLVTSAGGLALIVSQDGVCTVPLPCTLPTVLSWMMSHEPEVGPVGYLLGTVANRPGLRGTLDRLLPEIGRQLIAPTAAALRDLLVPQATDKPLVHLIPTGWLTLLPLHAACYAMKGTLPTILLDEFTITYLPSARVLQRPPRKLPISTHALLAIGDPAPLPQEFEPLPYARFEAAAVCGVTPGSFPPVLGENASAAALRAKWADAHTVHLACHGVFDPTAPLRSALILAGDKLTLGEVMTELVTGRDPREVVLSACQTALVEFDRLPEEAIGFPMGLIQAGVATVVAALWSVNDWSTSLLMAKYAVERKWCTPAAALRQAQVWLRDAAPDEVRGFAAELQCNISSREAAIIKGRLDGLIVAASDTPPFSDPYHWAGFGCWGAE